MPATLVSVHSARGSVVRVILLSWASMNPAPKSYSTARAGAHPGQVQESAAKQQALSQWWLARQATPTRESPQVAEGQRRNRLPRARLPAVGGMGISESRECAVRR